MKKILKLNTIKNIIILLIDWVIFAIIATIIMVVILLISFTISHSHEVEEENSLAIYFLSAGLAPELEEEEKEIDEPIMGPPLEVIIWIDKSTQRMVVKVDSELLYNWPVSTGKGQRYDTPSGTYTAQSMNKMWHSRQWDNAPMPHSVFFTARGHAIHGSKVVDQLGFPASHGCIRLSEENAEILFEILKPMELANATIVVDGITPGLNLDYDPKYDFLYEEDDRHWSTYSGRKSHGRKPEIQRRSREGFYLQF